MTHLQAALILLGMLATPHGQAESVTFERGLMGTRFAITCHMDDPSAAKKAAEEAFEKANQINRVASDYIADSELLALGRHPVGTSVAISPLLFQLISQARDIAGKTSGCFDPSIGPLSQLWRESRRRDRLPDTATLEAARAATGWQKFTLDPNDSAIVFSHPSMRLDLGGIAKGQSADAMLAVMQSNGIQSVCITAGGDVRLGDPPPDSKGWKIGVRTFDKDHDKRTLVLANCAVSTSGELHQSITIDGTRYSHIIDPGTGLGLTREVAATVIAPTATLSDALATACCAAPPGNARDMAISAGATEVYLEN